MGYRRFNGVSLATAVGLPRIPPNTEIQAPIMDAANRVALDRPLGRRIAVFGRAGKTSLARAIAAKHGLEFIEIDGIHHMSGWQERSDEEILQIVTQRMDEAEAGWVVDHHHRSVVSAVLSRADTLVLITLPWRTLFWMYLKRSFRRSWTGEEIAGGNRETWRVSFASRDSHLWHTIKTRKNDYRARFEPELTDRTAYYLIESLLELNRFYEMHGLTRR